MTKDFLYSESSSSSSVLCEVQQPVHTPNSDHAAIRGMTNTLGSNNCFLNCAVQGIWNLDPFRASFVLIDNHICTDKSCIFCSMLILAANYQYHEQGPIAPDILRNALAQAYQVDNRFQIGFMEDAAECLESILGTLHTSLSDCSPDSLCTAETCISHRLFSMTLIEQVKCTCGASSEPLTFDQYIFYVAVSSLTETHDKDASLTFGTLLKLATLSKRPCPAESNTGKCVGPAVLEAYMIEKPDVFCVGMAWTVSGESSLIVKRLVDCIEVEIDLDEVFENVTATKNNVYRLVGIMAYYGMHYFTFFFHSGIEKWLLYDDATVSEVGKTWDSVKKMLVKGKYQPLVLLYVNPSPEKPVASSRNVLSKAYNSLKTHKEKQKLKQRLAKLSSTEPSSKTKKESLVPSAPPSGLMSDTNPILNAPSSLAMKPVLTRQESFVDETTPEFMSHSRRFLGSMVTGVEEKMSAGLTLLGLQDGGTLYKKKFINDCVKQADKLYFEAKGSLNVKEYSLALDLTIDASHLYKFILSHEDATLAQRELVQVRYNTARIRAKRIARRIPTTHLTETQLSALYHRCPLCNNLREDEMQFCYDCTPYCKSCCKTLQLSEGDYCANCVPSFEETGGNGGKSSKISQIGKSSDIYNGYLAAAAASPPPYESLQKTLCRVCSKYIITTGGDLCHSCSSYRESDF